MPIIERTAEEAVRVFRRHLAELISGTLTKKIPLLHVKVGDRWLVEFRQGEKGATVPLNTRHGKAHLYLGQLLETVVENGHHRLQTLQYWYRVQNAPEPSDRATLRWEYNRDAQQTARHHAHAEAKVQIGTSQVDLDKVHLPTGWVTIEEVIRFVIQELGHKPPCGADQWPTLLEASEKRFYEDFTSKRYAPPESGSASKGRTVGPREGGLRGRT